MPHNTDFADKARRLPSLAVPRYLAQPPHLTVHEEYCINAKDEPAVLKLNKLVKPGAHLSIGCKTLLHCS
jgi:hypothetical protein